MSLTQRPVPGVAVADAWRATRSTYDLAQAVATTVATMATVACLARARRSAPAAGRPWWWYAAACGAWAFGQYAWSSHEVAARLRAVTRAVDTVVDTVARLGGDEFAVLLEDGADPGAVVARIAETLAPPVPVGAALVRVGGSVGAATVTPDEPTPTTEALLRRADRAMYEVKHATRRVATAASSGC